MENLSHEEQAILDLVLSEIHRRSGHAQRPTLERFIERWSTFVQEVETGYELSIYEYANDLSVRDILDEVIERVPSRLGNAIKDALQPWDDRFRFATRSSAAPVLPGADVAKVRRWWRVPTKLTGELRDDLISEGVITE